MPNIKSAIKRVQTNEKKRQMNMARKSNLRTSIKAVETAIAANDIAGAQQSLNIALKKLDKGVSKGIVHKNAAARKKSRLTKRVNALVAAASAE